MAAVDAVQALNDLVTLVDGGERHVTMLTGAGVSTESGVPDYRSPGSPWRIHKPIDFAAFVADPRARAEAWRRKFAMDDLYAHARPGRSHEALVDLAQAGKLRAVVTQNIDGLHVPADLAPASLVELHGNGTFAKCLTCGGRFALATVRRSLEATGEAPTCSCGGLIKSATIAFGQSVPREAVDAAVVAVTSCRLLVAVGTSLVVRPASALPLLAKRAGVTVAIVNNEPTPLDGMADLVVRGDAGDVLTALTCCL